MRPQTTFRTFVYFAALWLAACSDAGEEKTNAGLHLEFMEALLEDDDLFEAGYYEDERKLYIRVKTNAAAMTMAKRQAASTLQTGKAFLGYAQSKCSSIKSINLNLNGLSRLLSRVENGLYVELWAVPKKQINESIHSICRT